MSSVTNAQSDVYAVHFDKVEWVGNVPLPSEARCLPLLEKLPQQIADHCSSHLGNSGRVSHTFKARVLGNRLEVIPSETKAERSLIKKFVDLSKATSLLEGERQNDKTAFPIVATLSPLMAIFGALLFTRPESSLSDRIWGSVLALSGTFATCSFLYGRHLNNKQDREKRLSQLRTTLKKLSEVVLPFPGSVLLHFSGSYKKIDSTSISKLHGNLPFLESQQPQLPDSSYLSFIVKCGTPTHCLNQKICDEKFKKLLFPQTRSHFEQPAYHDREFAWHKPNLDAEIKALTEEIP